jgi:PKD repeat protein
VPVPGGAFLGAGPDCGAAPGDYTFTITGTSADGETASGSAVLTVLPETEQPPVADFIWFPDNLTIQFIDLSFTPGCDSPPIVEWSWDFGDGNTSSERDPIHTYAEPGLYDVTLTVFNAEGQSGSVTFTVEATPPPPPLTIFRVVRVPDRNEFRVVLRWSGLSGELVELFRNGEPVATTDNDGEVRDRFQSEETAFTWILCEQGGGVCTNTVSIDFGPDPADDQATITAVIGGEEIEQTVRIAEE